jgi:type IV pilus assembly protein PilW
VTRPVASGTPLAGRSQCGFSLLELLVAMALGLLVTVAAMTLYRSQRQSLAQVADATYVTDNGALALHVLATYVRMSGFTPLAEPAPIDAALFGCSWGRADSRNPGACLLPSRGSEGSDGVASRYRADTVASWPTAGGLPTDCAGNGLYGVSPVVTHSFYASLGKSDDLTALLCAGSGNRFVQPLVDGIERLSVRYRLRGAAGSVPAYAIARTRWREVVALDLCVIARGRLPGASRRYRDCDGRMVAGPDTRLRRSFSVYVALRNLPA